MVVKFRVMYIPRGDDPEEFAEKLQDTLNALGVPDTRLQFDEKGVLVLARLVFPTTSDETLSEGQRFIDAILDKVNPALLREDYVVAIETTMKKLLRRMPHDEMRKILKSLEDFSKEHSSDLHYCELSDVIDVAVAQIQEALNLS
jgi:hypothetical protein